MPEYKKQHYVPVSYLQAWCDPNTPAEQESYIWLANIENREISRKSPKNVFQETDFYTVNDRMGNRILELEHKLGRIESDFASLKPKLENHELILPEDRKIIALFAATMFSRTKLFKEINQEVWQEALDSIEKLPEDLRNAIKKTPIYEDFEQLKNQPMPFHMFHFVNLAFPKLVLMDCAIFDTTEDQGFITSDTPCIWGFPEMFNGIGESFFGLGSPNLSVLLPISPQQFIHLERKGPVGYQKIDSEFLGILNLLSSGNAQEFLINNKKEFKSEWFTRPIE